MSANTLGSYLTERVGQGTVLPVKVEIITERKRIKLVPVGLEGCKEVVAEEPNKNNNEEDKVSPMPYGHLGKSE